MKEQSEEIQKKEEQKKKDEFNAEQRRAIDSPLGQDVLIAAGAGSGKTKTLSKKVYKICSDFAVDPSKILVLTFTNKAAFEMKERIVKEFRKANSGELADKILSSHIQTFDSFSLYLVQQYASVLSLPSTISIMDSSILAAKANSYVDEIFEEYYENHDPRFLSLIGKFNALGDSKTKILVKDLQRKLANLLPSERDSFVKDYDERFLSESFLKEKYDLFLKGRKEKLKQAMKKACLAFSFGQEEWDRNALIEELKRVDTDRIDLESFSFGQEHLDKIFQLARSTLTASAEDLNEEAEKYATDETKDFWDGKRFYQETKGEEFFSLYKDAFYLLRNALRDSFFLTLKNGGSFDSQKKQILSFREDIHLLFEIVDKLEKRLKKFEYLSNAYSFQDISNMALSLLIDPKYEKVAKEIQDRFSYVLVDEYQDTNDFQEAFLNAISKKATLFTVGDAKQSIYGFRNSNCQLFLNRKELYQKEGGDKRIVIEMNKNYRSVEKILSDVNAIFEGYMSKEHGGIDYVGGERLDYDKSVDLFALARNNVKGEYGLSLLQYTDVPDKLDGDVVSLEGMTIIKDIKEKVESGYQVLDFGKDGLELRPCTYKDFAILIRKKKDFATYQKLFLDAGIPLNDEIETGYHDIDSILVLQNLVKMFSYYLGTSKENIRHLYLSLARSYLFGKKESYDDEKIYKTLQSKELWEKDPLLKQVQDFVQKEKDKTFSRIFLDMIREFRVLERLPLLGDVSNNVSKVESYYRLLAGQENIGEGLSQFVELFKTIDKYDIGISASSVTSLENAVSLMTIHQSKGLEFKIVYMPLARNVIASGNNMSAPDYLFSREYGLILPNYRYDEMVDTFLRPLYFEGEGSKVGEISEHVRLFYVALTRAKESLYLVGNPTDLSPREKETLLDMLDSTAHYESINENLLNRYSPVFERADLDRYHTLTKEAQDISLQRKEVLANADGERKEILSYLYEKLIVESFQEELSMVLDSFKLSLYDELLEEVSKDSTLSIRLLLLFYTGIDSWKDIDAFCSEKKDVLSMCDLGATKEELLEESKEFLRSFLELKETDFVKKHNSIREVKLGAKKNKDLTEEENLALQKSKKAIPLIFDDLLSVTNGSANFQAKCYPLFQTRVLSLEGEEKKEGKMKLPELGKKEESEEVLDETPITHKRASKYVSDEETISKESLSEGTLYHRFMENVDLRTKKIPPFLKDEERKNIEKVLSLPLFDDLSGVDIYKEYSFYDRKNHARGSIDLLLVRKDEIDIVDYKLEKISDPAYLEQLKVYKENVSRLFKTEKKIRTFLLSLLDARLKEIAL